MLINFADTEEALFGFVRDVAEGAARLGATGRIKPASSLETAFDRTDVRCLAAAACVPLDVEKLTAHAKIGSTRMHWYGREDASQAVLEEAIGWVRGDGPLLLRTYGFQVACSADEAARQLFSHFKNGIFDASIAGVAGDGDGRRVKFSSWGYLGVVVARRWIPASSSMNRCGPS